MKFDFCGPDLCSLFRVPWTVDLTLIRNRRLFSDLVNAVSYLRLHKGLLLNILALFIAIDHKYVVEALARAEVLGTREHCLHWHRLAILTNRHIGKGNLTFTSIGLCGTIYHLILALASHDPHQSVILIVQLMEVFVKVWLSEIKYQ